VEIAMKWRPIHRQPVRYGLTPSAFPEIWLLAMIAVVLGVSWLLRMIIGWLGA
jgi:hypothetical protein